VTELGSRDVFLSHAIRNIVEDRYVGYDSVRCYISSMWKRAGFMTIAFSRRWRPDPRLINFLKLISRLSLLVEPR